MGKFKTLLVALVSGIAITGISFIDGKIWEIMFYAVGLLSYTIVGALFSIGILSSRQSGRDAYILAFVFLALSLFGVYKILESIRNWIMSWPLFVKILVPSLIVAGLMIAITFVIIQMIKEKKSKITKVELNE